MSQAARPCHVAYCFDGAYALLTGVSLTSLLHNNPGTLFHIHCLVRDLPAHERQRLALTARRYAARLDFIELADAPLNGLPVAGHLSSTMIYARLLLPELLPAELERVLYLDSDTIILQDIGELFSLDLGNHSLAAVADPAHGPMGRRFNLPAGAYFNAGVQFMNLPLWRSTALGPRCIESLRQADAGLRFAAMDQDALNWQLQGNYLALPDHYNHGLYHKGEAVILGQRFQFLPPSPATRIIQFLGRIKPHMACYAGPGLELFERYRAASEWHDDALQAPATVADLSDWADRLVAEGRSLEAVSQLKNGLFTLADRLAQAGSP